MRCFTSFAQRASESLCEGKTAVITDLNATVGTDMSESTITAAIKTVRIFRFSFVGQVIYGAGGTKPVLYASSVHTARAKNTCQVDEGRMQYRAWVHLSREGVFNCEGQSRD